MRFYNWLLDRPTPLPAMGVVAGITVLLTLGLGSCDVAVRQAYVQEWMVECQHRCAEAHAGTWTYTDRNGCSCGSAAETK